MFTTDLMKRLKFPVFVDFLKVVSYKGTESKELTIQTKIDEDLYKDAHLIVIDDICDSGKTLAKLVEKMK